MTSPTPPYPQKVLGTRLLPLPVFGLILLFLGATTLRASQTFTIPDGDVPALIAALAAAQDGDVIELAEDGLYTLTEVNNETNGPNGLPVIRHATAINGNGAIIERDTGSLPFRIFTLVGLGSDGNLADLTVRNGSALYGGGIQILDGNPTISNCVFINNYADEEGGGIYSHTASPIIDGCTFQDNIARWGGGMANRESAPLITRCTFRGNRGDRAGGVWNELGGKRGQCVSFLTSGGKRGQCVSFLTRVFSSRGGRAVAA